MANAGPVVRWRTAVELLRDTSQSEALTHELLAQPVVRQWLARLEFGGFTTPLDALDAGSLWKLGRMVHGGKASCLENVFGKLAEFGLRAGMPELDSRPLPFAIFRWMPFWKTDKVFQNAWEILVKSVFAWGLLRLTYPPDSAMQEFLLSHLDTCHKIARDQVFDIYAQESELSGLPKAWVGKPILRQDVMASYWLPYIHDLYVFANFPTSLCTPDVKQKMDDLVNYILDPRFQGIHNGYGYAWIKERRTCYGWGWSPHFLRDSTIVLRLELLARFAAARQSALFQEHLAYLETFATVEGRYCFPAEYLRESEGYYVAGFGMGLGENRRGSSWQEIESTFRMLKIKSLLQSH